MIARHLRELSVATALVVLLGVLAVLAPTFYSTQQWWDVIVANTPVLVVALGMTLVIIARQIDISIGSQFCICGVISGLLATSGVPMPVVVVATILVGLTMGLINGWLVATLELPSIVVTLATMVVLREGLRWLWQGQQINNLPPSFQWFGLSQQQGQLVLVGLGVLLWGVGIFALGWLALGRTVYAVGSDQEAARLAGMRPGLVTLGVFAAMGALTGFGALLNAIRFPTVDPNAGLGLDLQVIAAVVVGGTAVSGGRGTLVGTCLGVLLLGTISPALTFLHARPEWEKAIQGAIILVAVASDAWPRRR